MTIETITQHRVAQLTFHDELRRALADGDVEWLRAHAWSQS